MTSLCSTYSSTRRSLRIVEQSIRSDCWLITGLNLTISGAHARPSSAPDLGLRVGEEMARRGVNPIRLRTILDFVSSTDAPSIEALRDELGFQHENALEPYITYLTGLGVARIVGSSFMMVGDVGIAGIFGEQYRNKLDLNKVKKQSIAEYFVGNLPWGKTSGGEPAGTLLLDAGTTTTYIAMAMVTQMRCPRILLTHSIHAALRLLGAVDSVRLFGGHIDPDYAANTALANPDAIMAHKPDVAVLAASSLDPELGVCCADPNQHSVKRFIAKAGNNTNSLWVVADSSKFQEQAKPPMSIWSDEGTRAEEWGDIEEKASLLTTLWTPSAGSLGLRGRMKTYRTNMLHFIGEFGDRMVVLDGQGERIPNPAQAVRKLD